VRVPFLNLEISDELLRAIRIRCAEEDVPQKDWVPRVLAEVLACPRPSSAAGGGDASGVPSQKRTAQDAFRVFDER
jgi:hypothetical protein